jgi:hypothetical protein
MKTSTKNTRTALKVTSSIKAGGLQLNHNRALIAR